MQHIQNVDPGCFVIVLVGLPASGKSSFAQTFYPHFIRLDGDALKSSANVLKALKRALDANTGNIIVDATNRSFDVRKNIIAECKSRNPPVKVICAWFNVPPKTCVERAKQREANNIAQGLDPKHIPPAAIVKMHWQGKDPTIDEGFECIGVTDPEKGCYLITK